MENTGFLEEITKIEDNKQNVEKIKNNVELITIYKVFFKNFF